jgi:uncharacterized protein YutD
MASCATKTFFIDGTGKLMDHSNVEKLRDYIEEMTVCSCVPFVE